MSSWVKPVLSLFNEEPVDLGLHRFVRPTFPKTLGKCSKLPVILHISFPVPKFIAVNLKFHI